MKTEGIESIFLTYANTSLKDNPEILYKIIDDYRSHFTSHSSLKNTMDNEADRLRRIAHHFTALLKNDDLQKAKEFYNQTKEFYKKAKIETESLDGIWNKLCEEYTTYKEKRRAYSKKVREIIVKKIPQKRANAECIPL
jgi:iron uptake system EfeUOB component EfeO/EfeM